MGLKLEQIKGLGQRAREQILRAKSAELAKSYAKQSDNLDRRLPDPITKRDAREESLASDQAEEGSHHRITVRITRCGGKLLDSDNLAGGCKYIIDALRREGLIPNDDPQTIELVTRQRKSGPVGTLIEVITNK